MSDNAVPDERISYPLCALVPITPPWEAASLTRQRLLGLNLFGKAWRPGMRLSFAFVDSPNATDAQKTVVRQAFTHWQAQGIALSFEEAASPEAAILRIAFDWKGRSNSAVGTENSDIRPPKHTMMFGWDLTLGPDGYATALHEIGHAIGLSHEHQHPLSPLVWDEQAVIKAFTGPPNEWCEKTIRDNILNKLPVSAIGMTTEWDVNSIMHYPFASHLIRQPPDLWDTGTPYNYKLSPKDIAAVQSLYPLQPAISSLLSHDFEHAVELSDGQTAEFNVAHAAGEYEFRFLGPADVRMTLLANSGNGLEEVMTRDNYGTEQDAWIRADLLPDTRYVLQLRKAYSQPGDSLGIKMQKSAI